MAEMPTNRNRVINIINAIIKITARPHGVMINQGMGNKYIISHGLLLSMYVCMHSHTQYHPPYMHEVFNRSIIATNFMHPSQTAFLLNLHKINSGHQSRGRQLPAPPSFDVEDTLELPGPTMANELATTGGLPTATTRGEFVHPDG